MQVLNSKYVLVNEICSKHHVNISSFSNMIEENEEVFLKLGGCLFLDTSRLERVPRRFLPYVKENYTDLTNTFPYAYLKKEIGFNVKILKKLGYVVEEFRLENKKFLRTTPEFTKLTKNYTFYKLDASELDEVKDIIKDKIQLSKRKYLVWY